MFSPESEKPKFIHSIWNRLVLLGDVSYSMN